MYLSTSFTNSLCSSNIGRFGFDLWFDQTNEPVIASIFLCILFSQNDTTHMDFVQTQTIITMSKLVTAHAIHQCLKFIYSGTIDSDSSNFKVFHYLFGPLFIFTLIIHKSLIVKYTMQINSVEKRKRIFSIKCSIYPRSINFVSEETKKIEKYVAWKIYRIFNSFAFIHETFIHQLIAL